MLMAGIHLPQHLPGRRFAVSRRYLPLDEADHVLATVCLGARFQLGCSARLIRRLGVLQLGRRSPSVRRQYRMDARLRYHLCASGKLPFSVQGYGCNDVRICCGHCWNLSPTSPP